MSKTFLVGNSAFIKTSFGKRKQTLNFAVYILESKLEFGRTRYLVTPMSGKGKAWVEKLSKK